MDNEFINFILDEIEELEDFKLFGSKIDELVMEQKIQLLNKVLHKFLKLNNINENL